MSTAPTDRTAGAGAELIYFPHPDPSGYLKAAIVPVNGPDGLLMTIVDPEVYPAVIRWAWHLSEGGYVVRSRRRPGGRSEKLRLHRVLMGCTIGDGLQIDHINRNPLDNRRANLRFVTTGEQHANRDLSRQKARRRPPSPVCRNGHIRTPETTRRSPRGSLVCLVCQTAQNIRSGRKRRQKT